MPWLMKAEPDSRIVKGKDVKVSCHIALQLIPVLRGRFRGDGVSEDLQASLICVESSHAGLLHCREQS